MRADRLLKGRVLSSGQGVLLLQVPGGALVEAAHPGGETARSGDLVRLGAACEVVHRHPTGVFPRAGTDAPRFVDPTRWERLRRRADLLHETRTWFRDEGFLEVDTPLVVPSPGTEVHLAATEVRQRPRPGAEPERRFLATSPEYAMKRLLAGGAPPIFQLGHVFRDGERGRNHRPEFSLLEWYRPWRSPEAILDDCERWIRRLAGGDVVTWQGRTLDLRPPWPRLPFHEALRDRGGVADPYALSADEKLRLHVERVEPTLGDGRPEFLVDWPIEMASLARPKEGDPRVAERFELFALGLELGNGFGELTDAAEQRRRCEDERLERRALGLPDHPLDPDFLGALEEGMPPSSGIAVGIDRVVMLLTDAADIDDVLPF